MQSLHDNGKAEVQTACVQLASAFAAGLAADYTPTCQPQAFAANSRTLSATCFTTSRVQQVLLLLLLLLLLQQLLLPYVLFCR
jgi:hypothetical protein